MTTAGSSARQTGALAALLRGEEVPWRKLANTADDLVLACEQEDLTALVYRTLDSSRTCHDWPSTARDAIARTARHDAVREELRRRAIATVLGTLARDRIYPILFKGAALAYSVYETPSARPRSDTDLLVRREDVEAVRRVMRGLGYAATPYCDGELLFCQFEMAKTDNFGVDHAFDIHWKISTQALFADMLDYETVTRESVHLPAVAPEARAAGLVHALLLACVHPAMHHRNEERLIWLYDVHLLASQLSSSELERFTALALDKRVAAVCRHQLDLARWRFQTVIPERVLHALSTPPWLERSAEYLPRDRRWHHELLSSMRALPRWRDRAQLAREVLLPNSRYMLAAYGVGAGRRSVALLPALYVHRALYGTWKILRGWK